jgi:hypothetical protein
MEMSMSSQYHHLVIYMMMNLRPTMMSSHSLFVTKLHRHLQQLRKLSAGTPAD